MLLLLVQYAEQPEVILKCFVFLKLIQDLNIETIAPIFYPSKLQHQSLEKKTKGVKLI